jgi:hypothetical protein
MIEPQFYPVTTSARISLPKIAALIGRVVTDFHDKSLPRGQKLSRRILMLVSADQLAVCQHMALRCFLDLPVIEATGLKTGHYKFTDKRARDGPRPLQMLIGVSLRMFPATVPVFKYSPTIPVRLRSGQALRPTNASGTQKPQMTCGEGVLRPCRT